MYYVKFKGTPGYMLATELATKFWIREKDEVLSIYAKIPGDQEPVLVEQISRTELLEACDGKIHESFSSSIKLHEQMIITLLNSLDREVYLEKLGDILGDFS